MSVPPVRYQAEARLKIATWITGFCNLRRRHSANDGVPPMVFEQQIIEERKATAARYTGTASITMSHQGRAGSDLV